jgi:hypothetical protein
MQIQIIDVGTPNTVASKNGRSYQSIEVAYKGADGKVSSKKLMSFSNPSVFTAISKMSKGDNVDITTVKDDAGYWQWTAINQAGATTSTVTPSSQSITPTTTRVTGSTYETKEEREARQLLIVRQSSLSNAVAILTVGSKSVDKEAVKALAQELADWVFNKPTQDQSSFTKDEVASFDDFDDDIPL